ncbi:MAG TPA: protein kinase [Gemmataceae bacterium]|jgi:serine/threonine-protein kinase|nr:protein kinase [Gemmataceae bacterium]
MTQRSEVCDPHRLDLFLRHRLPENVQRVLEAHLVVCPACRAKLDELAGGAPWWAAVRGYLGSDSVAELSRSSHPSIPFPPANIDLDFLEPSANPDSLGRLGSYEVLEVLGRGGMGMVLKAFDPALHRPVAIKVLAAEYAARGAARKRFAREAQAAAAVIHDHVVPVHAVDADASPPYLVMAFIPGQSLQERIDRSGPLELKEILRIGMQTACGLAAAHAQGLVHRDIKPANIMLENGIERVRITDFGLARAVDDASVSQKGAVAGTPQYMAPEQARGEAVDQRADLFALGSTLYAMSTGNTPFHGDSGLAVIRQVCDREPAPIRLINPDLPVWLEGIVRKLHAKDPAQRFQSASEVAELLEGCLAHLQQPAGNPLPRLAEELGRQVRGPGLSKRDRRFWRAGIAVVACILTGTALVLLSQQLGKQQGAQNDINTNAFAGTIPESIQSPTFDDDFRKNSDRLRAGLNDFRHVFSGHGFSAGSPSAPTGMEPALDDANRRLEKLRHDVHGAEEPGIDPVEAELTSIRQRLDLLRRHVGHFPD